MPLTVGLTPTSSFGLIFYDANWVLLHPSPEEPAMYLYAEATSKETTSNVIDEYSTKV